MGKKVRLKCTAERRDRWARLLERRRVRLMRRELAARRHGKSQPQWPKSSQGRGGTRFRLLRVGAHSLRHLQSGANSQAMATRVLEVAREFDRRQLQRPLSSPHHRI